MATDAMVVHRSAAAAEHWRAMGTDAALYISGHTEEQVNVALQLGIQRISILESLWSRFRDTSELTRLNQQRGTGPCRVTHDTARLVRTMLDAWHISAGACDASVSQAMRATGYDMDFSLVVKSTKRGRPFPGESVHVPGLSGVVVGQDSDGHATVSLPADVELDPGATGKGLAADILVEELRLMGVSGVMVNLGGDIVMWGSPASESHWTVEIDDARLPRGSAPIAVWNIDATGTPVAVATSTTLRRRWGAGVHHVIDPSTGMPSTSDVLQATVMANSGARAEALATMALVRGSGEAHLRLADRPVPHLLITTSDPAPAHTSGASLPLRRVS